MKAILTNECKIKAIAWDNEGVLVGANWNDCYDRAYEELRMPAPLAGAPSRGKQYKKMLSVPITKKIIRNLKTYVDGDEEENFRTSYSSGHISTNEFWPIVCEYGFGLDPINQNIEAIRKAMTFLLRDRTGKIRVFSRVTKIVQSVSESLPQYLLSNINPEVYAGLGNSVYLRAIREENRLFSIFINCRKPSTKSYKTLIARTGCKPNEILFIDDKESNIEAAQNCGIEGIVFEGQKESERALINRLETFGIVVSE